MPHSTVSFSEKLFKIWPQYILPHHFLSQIMHAVARCRNRKFKNWLIRLIVRRFNVDMADAVEPNLDNYSNFNEFFTRPLKLERRPFDRDPSAIICPVDGAVSQAQKIEDGRIFQAKGQSFTVRELLGGSDERAKPFLNGDFVTIYLSPRDYHRYHCPADAKLVEVAHIPGRLFSVNTITTESVPRLFARNERVAAIFDTPAGPMAYVMVGAIFVSSIETVWSGVITPPYAAKVRTWRYGEEKPYQLKKGDEVGRFNYGSTIIVLFGKDRVKLAETIKPGQPVRMGQRLATQI